MIELSEQHTEVRRMVRDFAENEVKPGAAERDETCEFPMQQVKAMGALGLMGVPVAEEYGGAGMDTLSYTITIEELARVCGSTAITVAAHTSLGTWPIYSYANEEQKKRIVPKLASGEWIGAFGLSEPMAGSDAQNTQTTAVLEGGEWVINGSKIFMTNGSYADTMVITARAKRNGQDVGIGAFLIETQKAGGIVMGRKEDKLGLRASDTRMVFFENTRIPADQILGEPGDGFKKFMRTLEGGRISIGALALGIAQGAYEKALRYAKERIAFGKPIAELQAIQNMLTDMAIDLEAARHLCYNAARLKDEGKPFQTEACMAKLFASEAGMRVCHNAVQILGGYGFIHEFDVERYLRDVKLCEIGEGTSEIQRIVIARSILK